MQYNVLLPQTTLKLWGIDLGKDVLIRQYLYVSRHNFDEGISETIYHLNSLIVGHINHDINFETKSLQQYLPNKNHEVFYDAHLLNLHRYYFKDNPSSIGIIDYATHGHKTLVYKDIKYPVEFLRAIKRNIILKQNFNPTKIISWDDYAKQRQHKLVAFGWQNIFCDSEKISKLSKTFLEMNKSNFEYLSQIDLNKNILLILPHSTDTWQNLLVKLSNLYNELDFRRDFEKADYIFVKNHRININNFPNELTLKGKKILCFTTNLVRLLPAEILIHGLKNIKVISVNSSSIYSSPPKNFYFMNQQIEMDKKAYGLMRRRLNLS
jgi:hypothetical protein